MIVKKNYIRSVFTYLFFLGVFFISFRSLSLPSIHITVADIIFLFLFISIICTNKKITAFGDRIVNLLWFLGGGIFLIWIYLTSFYHQATEETLVYSIQYIFILIIYPIVISYILKDSHKNVFILNRSLQFLLLSIVLVLLLNLFYTEMVATRLGRLYGFMNNPNAYSRLLAFVFIFLLALVFLTRKKEYLFKFFCTVCIIISLLLTGSFSGLLTLTLGVFAFLLINLNKKTFGIIVFFTLLTGFLLFYLKELLPERITTAFTASDIEEVGSFSNRVNTLETGLNAILENSIFGIGPNQFKKLYDETVEVHFSFVQLAIDFGVPSIIFICIFISGFIYLLFKSFLKVQDKSYLALSFSILVVFLSASMSSPSLFAREWWFFLIFSNIFLSKYIRNTSVDLPKKGSNQN